MDETEVVELVELAPEQLQEVGAGSGSSAQPDPIIFDH